MLTHPKVTSESGVLQVARGSLGETAETVPLDYPASLGFLVFPDSRVHDPGVPGPWGLNGGRGLTGLHGIPGRMGTVGAPGAPGQDGVIGKKGKKGEK